MHRHTCILGQVYNEACWSCIAAVSHASLVLILLSGGALRMVMPTSVMSKTNIRYSSPSQVGIGEALMIRTSKE
jgi:hypothetical protein